MGVTYKEWVWVVTWGVTLSGTTGQSNGDSILSKSELRAEMKRLANTEKAYSLMDSDSGAVTAMELAEVTKLDVDKARKAIEKVDANSDNVLSRQEFHDMINRNRIRHPAVQRGDRAF